MSVHVLAELFRRDHTSAPDAHAARIAGQFAGHLVGRRPIVAALTDGPVDERVGPLERTDGSRLRARRRVLAAHGAALPPVRPRVLGRPAHERGERRRTQRARRLVAAGPVRVHAAARRVLLGLRRVDLRVDLLVVAHARREFRAEQHEIRLQENKTFNLMNARMTVRARSSPVRRRR